MSGHLRGAAPLAVHAVVPFGQAGGAQRWLLDLLDATSRLQVTATLLEDGPLRGELEDRGIPVSLLPTGRGGVQVGAAATRLAGRLRRRPVEVVLASGVKAAAVALPAACAAGVPSVWAKHDFSHDRALARLLGRLADTVVAVSPAVAAATGRADAVLVPPPRPAPAMDHGTAAAVWRGLGVPVGERPVVGMATRLVPYKGVDTAIRALAHAEDWHLAVAGAPDRAAPEELDRLRRLAGAAGVADRVHLVGPVPAVGRTFGALDAVAILTRRDEDGFGREGYGIVALEAGTAGVPVIGARGNPEVERFATEHGAVVDPDPQAVAAALRRTAGADVALRVPNPLLAQHPDAAACAERLADALADAARRPGAGHHGGPPVSVVVCARDEEATIDAVVATVLPQLHEHDELVLVDDASVDRTGSQMATWARRDQRVVTITGPGRGVATARNVGFQQAAHAVIATTDAGCEPHDGWLDALRRPFASTSPPGVATGVYAVSARGAWQRATAVACFPDPAEARRHDLPTRVHGRLVGRRFRADRVDTRSLATSRAAWQAAGGFRSDLRNASDAAFGRAVLTAGERTVLAPEAVVTWHQRPSAAATARMYHRYAVGTTLAGDWTAVAQDVGRLLAYAAVAPLLRRGGSSRAAAVLGLTALLGPPAVRAARSGDTAVLPLLPAAAALKDLSRVSGLLRGAVAVTTGVWRPDPMGGRRP